MSLLITLLTLFGMKLADSTFATMKSVFTHQGRKYYAMFAITASQLIYLMMIKFMDNSLASYAVVAVAIMAGQVLGMTIAERMKKDSTWKIIGKVPFLTGEGIAKTLSKSGFEVETVKVYKQGKKYMNVVVYADTKQDTKQIKLAFEEGTQVEIIEIKDRIVL